MNSFFFPIQMFMAVFDHHNRGIDNHADGNGYPAKRHDVGIDSHELHDQESHEHAAWNDKNRDKLAAGMQQEQNTNQPDNNNLLQQRAAQSINGTSDQR